MIAQIAFPVVGKMLSLMEKPHGWKLPFSQRNYKKKSGQGTTKIILNVAQ
jgi:hypothetical protein